MFKALLIGLDVVAFAILGYIVGRFYGMEVYGTLIGALIGTAIMYVHYIWFMKKIEKTCRKH
jgi:O-antigen/teichoic acid export membrane protein